MTIDEGVVVEHIINARGLLLLDEATPIDAVVVDVLERRRRSDVARPVVPRETESEVIEGVDIVDDDNGVDEVGGGGRIEMEERI